MRLFVALDLPWELRERLAGLAAGMPGARWVRPENMHLTLRFIGEVGAPVAEEIDHALGAIRGRGFALTLGGLNLFHKAGRPSSLWIGATSNETLGRNQTLDALQNRIETALRRIGLVPERRRFTPHVTLARLDGAVVESRLAAYIQSRNLFRTEAMNIRHFALFSSLLGKEQAVYESEVEYRLDTPSGVAA